MRCLQVLMRRPCQDGDSMQKDMRGRESGRERMRLEDKMNMRYIRSATRLTYVLGEWRACETHKNAAGQPSKIFVVARASLRDAQNPGEGEVERTV